MTDKPPAASFEALDDILTTREVAAYLKVDPSTVRRLINRGALRACRIERDYRITKTDLATWMTRSQSCPGGE